MSLDEMLSAILAFSFILNLALGFFLKTVRNKFEQTDKAVAQANEDIHEIRSRQDVMEATYPTKEDLNQGLQYLSKDIHEWLKEYFDKGDKEDQRLSQNINELNKNVSNLMARLERREDESKH